MARKLERFCSEGKGNGLRAALPIRAGEQIFTADPYAHVVSKNGMGTTCEYCFSRRKTLLRCSQCKTAYYCKASCQKGAWPEHRRECKCLQSLFPPKKIVTDSVRLVARIIFKLLKPSSSQAEELRSLTELESHVADMSEQKEEGLGLLSAMLQIYLKEEAIDFSHMPPGLDLPSLYAKVTCNSFTISDGELQEVGVGLYLSMSLLNHDCRPNCVMIFQGTKLCLQAIQDIPALEELTISYIDTRMPSEERRRQLWDQYHFRCQCPCCTSADKDVDMLAGDRGVWRTQRDALPRIEELQDQQQWEPMLEHCQGLLDGNGDAVPDSNIYAFRLLELAQDACINLGQWEKALVYGSRTLQPYRFYYPYPHPALAVQLMRVGKLQQYLGRLEEAYGTLKQAYDVMKVTHGCEHSLTCELSGILQQCQAEMSSV
ncbi:histone-lysine N-methyltransferase SMYD3 [Brienomyrus brachyistius]|uniref:histone-lysine N-methyltransferase SMYD3 n=1 Tax=Brienomyrus brachyistius TaxID=42636 RepID=UPI0020B1932B|nr:histone-lysine N-methyltransferase SMYD3 [Brienomyrus brachyistius]